MDAVDADVDIVGELCLQLGALEVFVAKDRTTRDRMWETRRKVVEALNHMSPVSHLEDVVVPRSEIPAIERHQNHRRRK
jgi:glycolate oxidase